MVRMKGAKKVRAGRAKAKAPVRGRKAAKGNGSQGPLDFKAKLWLPADKLRNNMDAARDEV